MRRILCIGLALALPLAGLAGPAPSVEVAKPMEPALPSLGLNYNLGLATFAGDLSSEKGILFHDFQMTVLHVGSESGDWEAFLALDVLTLSVQHTGNAFPFAPGAQIRVLGFLFIPTLCSRHLRPLDLCLGIGQGTVNTNGGLERRDYGSWNYQSLVRYRFAKQWSAQLMGKYVGQVEQSTSGVESEFGFIGLSLGMGWFWY